jgi:hypothetical protein
MKIGQPYACDVCQTPKKEANHWWKAFLLKIDGAIASVLVVGWDVNRITAPGGQIQTLTVEDADAHLCGEECALKYISKNLFHSEATSGTT